MEKYVEKHMTTFVVLTCISFVWAVGVVFFDPNSDVSIVIERFQTLITGIFASGAAALTAVVVYTSATKPIREQERQRIKDRAEKEQIYAALLLEGLADVHACLEDNGVRGLLGSYQFPEILLNPTALETQKPEIAAEVSRVALMVKAYWGGTRRFGGVGLMSRGDIVVAQQVDMVIGLLEPISGLEH